MENVINSRSVDPREVAHYRKLADLWWDRGGPFWPLHALNELRVVWITDQLQKLALTDLSSPDKPLSGLNVLDVGSGGGILSESLAKLGAAVTGIDVVDKNISIAEHHANNSGLDISYRTATVEQLAEDGAKFDIVFNMEVVEHVADLPSYLHACNQVLSDGGVTFIATINKTWLAWLSAIIAAEYVLRWLPRGTHRYSMLRKPKIIKDLLHRDGLTSLASTGVRVNPLTRKFSFTPNMWINYMLMAVKETNLEEIVYHA